MPSPAQTTARTHSRSRYVTSALACVRQRVVQHPIPMHMRRAVSETLAGKPEVERAALNGRPAAAEAEKIFEPLRSARSSNHAFWLHSSNSLGLLSFATCCSTICTLQATRQTAECSRWNTLPRLLSRAAPPSGCDARMAWYWGLKSLSSPRCSWRYTLRPLALPSRLGRLFPAARVLQASTGLFEGSVDSGAQSSGEGRFCGQHEGRRDTGLQTRPVCVWCCVTVQRTKVAGLDKI